MPGAPHFARLRREDPVHRHAESPYGPYWSVTRYADIMKVELDHGTYSSASELGGIQIADQPKGQELPNFIRMDPPRHTAQRKTVAPIVAPANLANMEATDPRSAPRRCSTACRATRPFDWVDRVSTELTAMMLATLFDFPWDDRRKLTHWSDVAIANIEAADAVVQSEAERMAELTQMAETMAALWKERAAQPPKFDLISMMAHGRGDADHADAASSSATSALLIVGGNDTTRNSMTGGLMALLREPGRARQGAGRSGAARQPGVGDHPLADAGDPHAPHRDRGHRARRQAHQAGRQGRDVVRLGQPRRGGDRRRPSASSSAAPRARQHLSFGAGIHRCVGDRLAEMQLKILWEEILKRDLAIEVAGPPVRLYSNFIRGIRSLPVVIHS